MHKAEITTGDLRSFGFIMAGFIAVLFGLFFPWLLERPWPTWPWVIALAFFAPALLFPTILRPVYRIWMKFGMVLGWINTRIILAIVFYLLFTPYSLILKLLGKDPLNRKYDNNIASYRVASKKYEKENIEHPF